MEARAIVSGFTTMAETVDLEECSVAMCDTLHLGSATVPSSLRDLDETRVDGLPDEPEAGVQNDLG